MDETMRCLLTKSSQNAVSSPPFGARLAEDAKRLQGRVSSDPTSPGKHLLPELFTKK